MRFLSFIPFLLILSLLLTVEAAIKLKKYNVDSSSVTTSGISSGAAMATNFHFAHSSEISGAALVAGVPFVCGFGGVGAATACMQTPNLVNLNYLIAEASSLAATGLIDSPSGISGDKVFIFHGSQDSVVRPPSGTNIKDMYSHYNANIKTEFTLAAEHGFPTNNYGGACGSITNDYINNCGYQGAYEMLNFLYGNSLSRPNGNEGNLNNLFEFDQSDFFLFAPSLSSMDTIGYVYVPTSCQNNNLCKLHISFHGCLQSRSNVGNVYAAKSGFIDVAEINDMIIIFPQITPIALNPNACWDWFGYLNNYFPTKDGNQILAAYRMMKRVING